MKVTIMGLGLNGGGLESARYLARRGALCTITDMKDEAALAPSIEQLEASAGNRFRYVLGRHEIGDFKMADMVIKNPSVRPDSPYLAAARRVETDISLFLAASPARLTAVTGSKGKSSTSSAIHRGLSKARETGLLPGKAWLGGNITISPLSFLDKLGPDDDVVLELSSWQLGDLRPGPGQKGLLKPRAAVLTAIMPDHQDRYGAMEPYVNDKRIIYQSQDRGDLTVAFSGDSWGKSFLAETPGRPLPYGEEPLPPGTAGGWIDPWRGEGMIREASGAEPVCVLPSPLPVPGRHQRKNLLAAALALVDLGIPVSAVRESLGSFPGIEHRLEFFHELAGIRFYNDTAATIPEAAAAAVDAFAGAESAGKGISLVLVTGGTDKSLDFTPLVRAAAETRALVLLKGTGSDKLMPLLAAAGLSWRGPYDDIGAAARSALEAALDLPRGPNGAVVILSPGCTSFGMFKNEFDRGRQWKEAVRGLSA